MLGYLLIRCDLGLSPDLSGTDSLSASHGESERDSFGAAGADSLDASGNDSDLSLRGPSLTSSHSTSRQTARDLSDGAPCGHSPCTACGPVGRTWHHPRRTVSRTPAAIAPRGPVQRARRETLRCIARATVRRWPGRCRRSIARGTGGGAACGTSAGTPHGPGRISGRRFVRSSVPLLACGVARSAGCVTSRRA